MRTAARLLALWLLTFPSIGRSQTPVAPVGQHVRITRSAADGAPLIGTIVAWRGDTLILRSEEAWGPRRGDHAIPVNQMTALEVPGPKRGSSAGGMVLGGLIGTAAGAAIGSVIVGGDDTVDCTGRRVGECLTEGIGDAISDGSGVIGMGLLGLVVGAVIGADMSKSGPTWQKVVLPNDTQRIALIRSPKKFGVRIRF